MNLEVKKMFLSKPMVYFQNARKISSYLVRAKLHRLCRNVGPKYLVKEYGKSAKKIGNSDTFNSGATGEVYKINLQFNTRCLIYLFRC